MSGRGYCIFDTMIGRCGIAWGHGGIVGVQLPEAREIETRRRLYQLYPDAREQRPTPNVEIAIEGIVALLRGSGLHRLGQVHRRLAVREQALSPSVSRSSTASR